MTRKLKVLGLGLLAACSVSAVMASGAAAQQGMLTSDGPVTLTGQETGVGQNYATMFGLKAECPGSSATGHKLLTTAETNEGKLHQMIPSGATTITGAPHINFGNCVVTGGFPLTTDFNGCDYVTHIGQTVVGTDSYAATTDIVCPPGNEIIWTVFTNKAADPGTPFCILRVKPQTGLVGATATDTTNGTIDITGEVKNIHVLRTGVGTHNLLCPNNTTTATGAFHVDATVTGHNAVGESTAISLSHN